MAGREAGKTQAGTRSILDEHAADARKTGDPERGGRILDAVMKSMSANAVSIRDPNATESGGEADTLAFSRSQAAATGLPQPQVVSIIDAIRARWTNAPEIVVVENMGDPLIPEDVRAGDVRQLSQAPPGSRRGSSRTGGSTSWHRPCARTGTLRVCCCMNRWATSACAGSTARD